jgi:hypothetical protein
MKTKQIVSPQPVVRFLLVTFSFAFIFGCFFDLSTLHAADISVVTENATVQGSSQTKAGTDQGTPSSTINGDSKGAPENWWEILSFTKFNIGMVCVLLIGAGILALRNMKPESPLAPYVLQILGLTFILPVVVIITITIQVEAQAIMGLLGTIVGYIFGSSRGITPTERREPVQKN